MSTVLAWSAWRGPGAGLVPAELLALALAVGAPLGAVGLLLGGVLLRTGGGLLGGQAGAAQVRAVLAWAAAPLVAGLPLLMIEPALHAAARSGSGPAAAQGLLAAGFGALHIALGVWAIALSLVGLAAAHGFGLGRAAASWLLAACAALLGLGLVLGGAAAVIGLRGG